MSNTLKREFTLWSAFAFAFAFISPIVAIYGIFGLAYSTIPCLFNLIIPSPTRGA